MNTTDKSYSRYAGRLEGFIDNLPRTVVTSSAGNLTTEERIKFAKALEEIINKELPRLQEVKP